MPVNATSGTRSSYNQAASVTRLDVSELLTRIAPFDTPVTDLFGSEPLTSIKPEWNEDDLRAQFAVCDATSAAASTTIVVTALTAGNLRPGDIIQKRGGTVQALITGISTVTLTVVRPFGGSTDEGLVATDVLQVVGHAPVEGADPQAPRTTDPVRVYNHSQIFQEGLKTTRTQSLVDQYGITDRKNYDFEKAGKELGILRERAVIRGRRSYDAPTQRRAAGGLDFYIRGGANDVSGTRAQIEANLNAALQSQYENGGMVTHLIVPPAYRTLFSSIGGDRVTEERGDTGVGRTKSMFMSDFGQFQLVTARELSGFKFAIGVDASKVKHKVMTPWAYEELAKTGDSDAAQIIGEYSLEVRHQLGHFIHTVTDL